MLRQPSQSKAARAFSLIEVAIVLGIIGLVIGGIWAAVASVKRSRNVGQSVVLVRQVLEEVKKSFTDPLTQLSGSQYFEDVLVATGGIPADLVDSPTYVHHPFGGQFRVRAGLAPVTYMRVIFNNMPSSACVPLINALVSGTNDTWYTDAYGMYQVSISGTLLSGGSLYSYSQSRSVPANVRTACQAEGTQIIFYYYIPWPPNQ